MSDAPLRPASGETTGSRRIRFGVAMAAKGGRSTIIGVEVREGRDSVGRLMHHFTVGSIDRVTPGTVEALAERVKTLMTRAAAVHPCTIIDVGTPQGMALHQVLRGAWSRDLHRAHAYPGTGIRGPLFSSFLQAYGSGRVTFAPDLPGRKDLDKALVFYAGGGISKHGVDLTSEEEAMVIALGLALTWPKHGPVARKIEA